MEQSLRPKKKKKKKKKKPELRYFTQTMRCNFFLN